MTAGANAMDPRVLVVDDERSMREALEMGLRSNGFCVRTAENAKNAMALLEEWEPEAIVLDVMMPYVDGISLIPLIRRRSEAPIIMLSAKVELDAKVASLSRGADDYLAKPFELAELVARIHSRLRRPQLAKREVLQFADLHVDMPTRTASRSGERIALSTREFDLLVTLLRQPGRVFSREQLIDLAWGEDAEVAPNAVETYISYLRGKIERGDRPRLIYTIRGAGYSLRLET